LNKARTRIFLALALLISIAVPASFQACSQKTGSSTTGSSALSESGGNSNGGFDGKTYISRDFTGTCSDGIKSMLKMSPVGDAVVFRDNCVDVTPYPLPPRSAFLLPTDNHILLRDNVYDAIFEEKQTAALTLPLLVCRGQSRDRASQTSQKIEIQIRRRVDSTGELWARMAWLVQSDALAAALPVALIDNAHVVRFGDASVTLTKGADGSELFTLIPTDVPPPEEDYRIDRNYWIEFYTHNIDTISIAISPSGAGSHRSGYMEVAFNNRVYDFLGLLGLKVSGRSDFSDCYQAPDAFPNSP